MVDCKVATSDCVVGISYKGPGIVDNCFFCAADGGGSTDLCPVVAAGNESVPGSLTCTTDRNRLDRKGFLTADERNWSVMFSASCPGNTSTDVYLLGGAFGSTCNGNSSVQSPSLCWARKRE